MGAIAWSGPSVGRRTMAGVVLAAAGAGGLAAALLGGAEHVAAHRAVTPAALPLVFEANRGQAPAEVRFVAHASGATLGFARGDVRIAARDGQLRMTAVGGRLGEPLAAAPQSGRVNYLVGADRARWLRDVPTYGQVRYRSVWPGIDLLFRGTQGALEYDAQVAPGADPRRIALALPGAERVRATRDGGVTATLAGRPALRMAPPVAYQDGADGRRTVIASHLVVRHRHVGFALGTYDRSRPLTIDPSVALSSFVGGRSSVIVGVGADAQSDVYVAGHTPGGNDLATTPGAYQPAHAGSASDGNSDVVVEKLNPSGTAVLYATYLGTSGFDYDVGLAVDAAGNAYISGTTNATTGFPTTSGALQTTYGGSYADGYITKLDPTGAHLVYSTLIGGAGQDSMRNVALHADGSVSFGGNFPSYHGCDSRGGAVGRLNAAGSALSFYTCVSGGVPYGVAVGPSDSTYVAGLTQSASFGSITATPGAAQTAFSGKDMYANNAFAQKYDASGAVVYSTFLGGGATASDSAAAIAVDASGNAYVTGVSTAAGFPTTSGAVQTASPGGNDAFALKLNPAATSVLYATLLGGTATDRGEGIAVDGDGHAYVTGAASAGFPVTSDAAQPGFGGSFSDAYLTELATDGKSLVYSTYLGGSGQDSGYGAAMAPNGNVLFGGGAGGPFPVTNGAANTTAGAGGFVAEIGAPVAGGGGGLGGGGGGQTTTTTVTNGDGTTTTVTTVTPVTAPGLVETLTTSSGQQITIRTLPGQEGYAALEQHLLGGLSGDDMARLLANGGFSVQIPLTYPAYPGTYSGQGTASPSGIPGYDGQGVGGGAPPGYDSAVASAAARRRPVTLFTFRHTYTRLGTYTARVKLTAAGKKLLRAANRAHRKLKVTVSVTVAAKGHRTVRHHGSVTLKPGKAAARKK
ncbi:SBBP repeat-containing protein [Conexibacter woesei]|uniref:DUF7948 domain-containing protein n=1 Tax=Conexibacter woesei TaxID=191495 RepID=UPI0012DC94BB|nr:SBBP repeat-containing protein [Conexibacter woesei]